MLFMGVDVGTQGVRAIVVTETGNVITSNSVNFENINQATALGYCEQNPEMWWRCACQTIVKAINDIKNLGFSSEDIIAISVDGTSGTILPLDKDNKPLFNGIMYNDVRSKSEAATLHVIGRDYEKNQGYRFNASFALPKILWIKNNMPAIYEKTHRIVHQADYVVGNLSGEYGISDYSNALKTGYDLTDENWPQLINEVGLDISKLPKIIAPGEIVGKISRKAADELGLSTSTYVVAGATDGYASALAAGAVHVGDWTTIIGTTLVIKGVSQNKIIDASGNSYSHKLPSGAWMVGGASNVGGRCLNNRFEKSVFKQMDQKVDLLSPTGILIYPLVNKGERYPFLDSEAEEFIVGQPKDDETLYTALIEGVGYVERLAYDLNIKMGCEIKDEIFTTGGACRSDEWLKIRASIMNRAMKVPEVVDATIGTAMIAASKTYFSNLEQAAENMIKFNKVIEPDKEKSKIYGDLYLKFKESCKLHYKIDWLN
ncbi:MAG TPA: FGGY-family carbohydrate kinase [Ruminiclostridium sp.]